MVLGLCAFGFSWPSCQRAPRQCAFKRHVQLATCHDAWYVRFCCCLRLVNGSKVRIFQSSASTASEASLVSTACGVTRQTRQFLLRCCYMRSTSRVLSVVVRQCCCVALQIRPSPDFRTMWHVSEGRSCNRSMFLIAENLLASLSEARMSYGRICAFAKMS